MRRQLGQLPNKFKSPHAQVRPVKEVLNEINESLVEDQSSDFERDENATDINISQSLGLGHNNESKKAKNSKQKKSTRAAIEIQDDLALCREASDEQPELDEDEDSADAEVQQANAKDQGTKTTFKMDDSLQYTYDTLAPGGNSTLGASGGDIFFQNNLASAILPAEPGPQLSSPISSVHPDSQTSPFALSPD